MWVHMHTYVWMVIRKKLRRNSWFIIFAGIIKQLGNICLETIKLDTISLFFDIKNYSLSITVITFTEHFVAVDVSHLSLSVAGLRHTSLYAIVQWIHFFWNIFIYVLHSQNLLVSMFELRNYNYEQVGCLYFIEY